MIGQEPRFIGEVSERSHKNMSSIKGKDTSIEIILRRKLRGRGYQIRKNYKEFPECPDIVIAKYRIAIFCDSEIFHGKDQNELKQKIKAGKNSDCCVSRLRETSNVTMKKICCFGLKDGYYCISGEKKSKIIPRNVSDVANLFPCSKEAFHP